MAVVRLSHRAVQRQVQIEPPLRRLSAGRTPTRHPPPQSRVIDDEAGRAAPCARGTSAPALGAAREDGVCQIELLAAAAERDDDGALDALLDPEAGELVAAMDVEGTDPLLLRPAGSSPQLAHDRHSVGCRRRR